MLHKKRYRFEKGIFSVLFLFLTLLLTIASLTYHYAMLPRNMERLLMAAVAHYTQGELSVKVKHASLLYGFELEDGHLQLRETKQELLSFKRLRFNTFLAALLIGEISIRDLTIEQGRLQMHKTKAGWNWAALIPASQSKALVVDKDTITIDSRDHISLPFPIRLHMKLDFRDFTYIVNIDEVSTASANGNTFQNVPRFSLQLQNLNFQLSLITRSFSEILLNAGALRLFTTFILSMELPSSSTFALTRRGLGEMSGHPKWRFFIFQERHRDEFEFYSQMSLQTRDMQLVSSKKNIKQALDIKLAYNISYDASADRLVMNKFHVEDSHQSRLVFNHVALNHISSNRPTLQLDIGDSYIYLNTLGEILAMLAGEKESKIGGELGLTFLSAFGSLDELRVNGKLEGTALHLRMEETDHNLTSMELDFNGNLYLGSLRLSQFLASQLELEFSKPNSPLAYGIFHWFHIDKLELLHSKGYLQAKADIIPELGIQAKVLMEDCDLEFLTLDHIKGLASADVVLHSLEGFDKVAFDLNVHLQHVNYEIGRFRAKPIYVKLKGKGKLDLNKGIHILVQDLQLQGSDREGETMLTWHTEGLLHFSQEERKHIYRAQRSSLFLHIESLYPTLPRNLQLSLAPYKSYMVSQDGKNLGLQASLFEFKSQAGENTILMRGRLSVPKLYLDDLDVDLDMDIGSTSGLFHQVKLEGFAGAFHLQLDGTVRQEKDQDQWQPRLRINTRLFSEKLFRIHENVLLQGKFELKAKLQPEKMDVLLNANNLNLEFLQGDCSGFQVKDCKSLFVQDVVIDHWQIEHLWQPKLEGGRFINLHKTNDTPGLYKLEDYNLRIGSISSSHNPQGDYIQSPKRRWHYLGNPKGADGLQAIVTYHNNVLNVSNLKLNHFLWKKDGNQKSWVRNGIIKVQELSFNFADLEPERMTVALQLKLQDLDLQPLLPRLSVDYDGIISSDVKIQVNSFDGDLLYNTDALVSMYRVSPELARLISGILIPNEVVSFLARSTLGARTIKTILKHGLIYSYMQVERADFFPGVFFSSSNKEVRQERMPIAQFLKRVRGNVANLEAASF